MQQSTYLDPAGFPLRELELNMVRSGRLAARCRRVHDIEQAELHILWMNILLDEWARRRTAARGARRADAAVPAGRGLT
jgi:hypothetical protein